jgi:hypothetical protein
MQFTALTLTKCKTSDDVLSFAEAIYKFHMRCQFRGTMRHIIVDASNHRLQVSFFNKLKELPEICGLELHNTQGSFREDYNFGFTSIRTKYAIFFLPDHVLEVQAEDFLTQCAVSLDKNPDVYQIHLSGPYSEWSVETELLSNEGFQSYTRLHNPFRIPFYPWFRVNEDELWYGGRLLYSKGLPRPGNPLVRRVVEPGRISLWVSLPISKKEPIHSQAPFIGEGGTKHLALGFNGAPCFFNMEIFKNYLPIPHDVTGLPAEIDELYFYRHTDLDQRYSVAWLNAQTFFWHNDYGWALTDEISRSLFREILMRKEL